MIPFSQPSTRIKRWFTIPGRVPGGKTATVWEPLLIPLKLALRLVHTEPLAICQLQFRFSFLSTGSQSACCYWGSAHVNDYSLSHSPFGPFIHGGSVFLSPMGPRRVDEFSVGSSFCLLLGQSGDFTTPTCGTRNGVVNQTFMLHITHLFFFLWYC